jgi:hypothetical protein
MREKNMAAAAASLVIDRIVAVEDLDLMTVRGPQDASLC